MPKTKLPGAADPFGARLVAMLKERERPRHGAGAYLAKRYKVAIVTANAWLNGEYKPEIPLARRIAHDHGWGFDKLYFGEDQAKPAEGAGEARAAGAEDLAAAVGLTLTSILQAVAGQEPGLGRAILRQLEGLKGQVDAGLQQRVIEGAIAAAARGLESWESEGQRGGLPASAGKPRRRDR